MIEGKEQIQKPTPKTAIFSPYCLKCGCRVVIETKEGSSVGPEPFEIQSVLCLNTTKCGLRVLHIRRVA